MVQCWRAREGMEREFGFAFIDESTEHYLMNIALNSYCMKPVVHQFHRKHILVTVIQEENTSETQQFHLSTRFEHFEI